MDSPQTLINQKTKPAAWAVIVAGGVGSRFCAPHSHHPDKLLATLGGLPLFVRTVEVFNKAHTIQGIILVTHSDKRSRYKEIATQYGIQKPLHVVSGGDTRRASVYNGLCALHALNTCSIVAIHDAARPMIDANCIDRAVTQLALSETAQGVVVGIPIHDTIKRIDSEGMITQTIDRQSLWRAQTPQVFWINALKQAHESTLNESNITDDSQLMEATRMGPIEMLMGNEHNLKITTPEDLITAELWLHHLKHPHHNRPHETHHH